MEGCASARCLNKAGPSTAWEPLRLHSAHAMQQAAEAGRRASPELEVLLTPGGRWQHCTGWAPRWGQTSPAQGKAVHFLPHYSQPTHPGHLRESVHIA